MERRAVPVFGVVAVAWAPGGCLRNSGPARPRRRAAALGVAPARTRRTATGRYTVRWRHDAAIGVESDRLGRQPGVSGQFTVRVERVADPPHGVVSPPATDCQRGAARLFLSRTDTVTAPATQQGSSTATATSVGLTNAGTKSW